MNRDAVVQTIVVVGIVTVVASQLWAVAASDEVVAFHEESEEWCDERNGTLWNAQVIGDHGGLHCELPNGTSVHMDEVVSDNSPSSGGK